MLVTAAEAVAMATTAQTKLRAFDKKAATVAELLAFCAEMEDEARSQAANLRDTLAFLVATGNEESEYAQALRSMLPKMDLLLCKMTEIDLSIQDQLDRGETL
jgi:hypothetical protein